MKNLNSKNIKLSLSLILLSLLTLAGCSDGGSSTSTPSTYSDEVACQNQNVPVGIPGNSVCPYLGEYDSTKGYQPFALHYSASVGAGFVIDFGWDYEDECPEEGQLAVYENGRFSYCTDVNPIFARTDFGGNNANNFAECAGEQYNMAITGCGANLKPSQPQYSW